MLSFHHTNNMRLASTLMLMFTPVNRHDLCHKSSKCVVGGLFWSLSLNPPSINLLCVPSVNVRCSTTQHQTMQAKGDEYSIAEFISQCSTFSKKKIFFWISHSFILQPRKIRARKFKITYTTKVLNFFISKIKVSEFYFLLLLFSTLLL